MNLRSLAAPLLCVAGIAQGLQAQSAPGVEQVAWLSGCWENSTPKATVEERWMAPRGGSMLGVGRTVAGGTLREWEVVVLSARDGRLAYEAHPSGQDTTTFHSIVVSDTTVVFENPSHDFPQRVGYRRIGTDSLIAWIEGTRGGSTRRIDFPYRRVHCES